MILLSTALPALLFFPALLPALSASGMWVYFFSMLCI